MSISSEQRKMLKLTILIRICILAVFLIVLFWGTSGSWRFWQAWVFSGTFLLSGVIGLAYLYRNEPDLLLRRMRVKEKRSNQRKIIYWSYPFFLGVLIIPGLDFRFGWSHLPVWLVLCGDLLYLLGYGLFMWVVITNRYAGRTVEVEEEQKVIQTGPYAWVRHPMYVSSILSLGLAPLALGSIPAVMLGLLIVPFIILRILDEENALRADLPGYAAYCEKVRYRLLPGIW